MGVRRGYVSACIALSSHRTPVSDGASVPVKNGLTGVSVVRGRPSPYVFVKYWISRIEVTT
jgi:hypothetical protein